MRDGGSSDEDPLIPHNDDQDNGQGKRDPELERIFINDQITNNRNFFSLVITFICVRLKVILSTRYFWKCLLLGQLISVLLCGTGVTSGLLADRGIHVPTAQNFLNYFLLSLVFTVSLACRQGDRSLGYVLKTSGWKYFVISVADVEANYLVVKAYSYTTITSVQLLDCFSIVTVLVLSICVLGTRYHFVNGVGVITCVLGLIALVLTDSITENNKSHSAAAPNKILGDCLCVGGAFLYGVSNVAQEFVVKHYDRTEFLAMLGLFGSFINGIQFVLLERHELQNIDFTSVETVLCLVGFTACQFILYSCMTVVIQKTSATTVNISLLTADFYTLLFGLFLFHYQFHGLYIVSFCVVLFGVAIYGTREPSRKPENTATNSLNKVDSGQT